MLDQDQFFSSGQLVAVSIKHSSDWSAIGLDAQRQFCGDGRSGQDQHYFQYFLIQILQTNRPTIGLRPKMKQQNQFVLRARNERTLQQSIRLMQYINMYHLKKDQIIYQCPVYLSEVQEKQFDLEVQCVEEMADVDIIYRRDRKREFQAIREEDRKEAEAREKDKKSKGIFGSVLSMFGSKSKNKDPVSPMRRSLNNTPLKSRVYATKMTSDETLLSKSKQKSKLAASQFKLKASLSQSVVQPVPIPDRPANSPIKIPSSPSKSHVLPAPASPPALQEKSSDIFDEEELQQVDLDELENAPDSISSKSMPKIDQEQGENASSIRFSKVSRVSVEDLQATNKGIKSKGRLSKRVIVDSQEEENGLVNQNKVEPKSEAFKKISQKLQPKKSLVKKASTVSNQSSKSNKKQRQSPKNSGIKAKKSVKQEPPTQVKTQARPPSERPELPQIIQRQLSRISAISKGDLNSSVYSMISSADVLSQPEPPKEQPQKVDDSFSDIKIDWFAKIEACELQENLLLNRMKNTWSRPLQNMIKRLENLQLSNFTQEINNDPRYIWTRPNLNFGKVIE